MWMGVGTALSADRMRPFALALLYRARQSKSIAELGVRPAGPPYVAR